MKIGLKYSIARFILKLISKTWRYRVKGVQPKSSGIIAFWHGDMLPVWKYFSSRKPIAVVSPSKDGEILSGLLSDWDYSLIRGSSSKKSKETLNGLVSAAKNNLVLITPDGPRGPINVFKPGAIVASQRSSTKLYLCNVNTKSRFRFKKSWDKFSLPLPFSLITMFITELGIIPENANREEIDKLINHCTNILNSQI